MIRALGMRPWYGASVYVARAHQAFDRQGRLTDDDLREQLRRFLQGFQEFIG